jgi:hypothetical protein
MHSKSRLLIISLFFFLLPGLLFAATKQAKAPMMLQAVFGPRPPLREATKSEKRGFQRLIDMGYLKEAPTKVRDEPTVSVKSLSIAERDAFTAEIGKSFDKLPSPVGAKVKSPPDIPVELRNYLPGPVGYAVCVFEVLPDGLSGRVVTTDCSDQTFFRECAKALSRWEFEPSNEPRFFRILFTADINK